MNKLFTKIAAACVGIAMAVGAGVTLYKNGGYKKANAADVSVYVLDGTDTTYPEGQSSTYGAYDSLSTMEQDDITWKVQGNTTTNPWRIGGKKSNGLSSAADRVVYSNEPITSDNISKVVFTSGSPSGTEITLNSFSLVVSDEANGGGTVIDTIAGEYAANDTTTFLRPNGHDWSDAYFSFVFNMVNNTTTQKYITIVSIEFFKDVELVAPDTVTISGNSGVTVGSTLSLTATATKNSSSAGVNQNVTWSSLDESKAVVNNSGVVTGVSNGEVTIKAASEDNPETVFATKVITVSGGKTSDVLYSFDSTGFPTTYGNNYVTSGNVYLHINQTSQPNGKTYIQMQASVGLIENKTKLPSKITIIELTINEESNGAGYLVYVSENGSDYSTIDATTFGTNKIQYSVTSGNNYYFKIVAGTGTLRLDKVTVGLNNSGEVAMRGLADSLNSLLDGYCVGAEATGINASRWENVKNTYDSASEAARNALAAVEGETFFSVDKILQRYDYCITNYGFTDFLGRSGAGSRMINDTFKTNSSLTIIVVVSVLSISALGFLFLLKKKKEN